MNGRVGEYVEDDEADGFRGCGGVLTDSDASRARDGERVSLGEPGAWLERVGVLGVAAGTVAGRVAMRYSAEGARTVRRISDGERGSTAAELAEAGAVVGRGSCSCRLLWPSVLFLLRLEEGCRGG